MASDQVRLVTVSASYGAGGSVVAPALADRLGVPFLQRATTSEGGSAGPEPCIEPLTPDEAKLTPAHWLLAHLTAAMPAGPTQSPPPSSHQQEHLRRYCEEGIRRLADANAGVILGRGAAVVLGKGRGFHVRLDGPPASASCRAPPSRGSARTRPAGTWTRPTGPAKPTCAASTAPIRPTRATTTWSSTPPRSRSTPSPRSSCARCPPPTQLAAGPKAAVTAQ